MRWTLLMLLAHRTHLLHLLITDGMETSHVIKCVVQKVIGLECSFFSFLYPIAASILPAVHSSTSSASVYAMRSE